MGFQVIVFSITLIILIRICYSFDEIGYYDIPAFIDYILEKTSKKSLYYFGHSQGTTAFFAMASQRPEYSNKVSLMIAAGPIAYLSNSNHPILKEFSPYIPAIKVEYLNQIPKSLIIFNFLVCNIQYEILRNCSTLEYYYHTGQCIL